MSFSTDVKRELSGVAEGAVHCKIAEMAAIFFMCGNVSMTEEKITSLKLVTENVIVARRFYRLLKDATDIRPDLAVIPHGKNFKDRRYVIAVLKKEDAARLAGLLRITDANGFATAESVPDDLLTMKTCCKRAYIRGAFLCGGSISDPVKNNYHFEIVSGSMKGAEKLKNMLGAFDIDAKIVGRKKAYVTYVKEAGQIVDILNVMGAGSALMEMENVRILKDVRNRVNRRFNCEMANINKTARTSARQIADIEYIKDTVGLDYLDDNLAEMALKDLGEKLPVPIGKSGVNHRLNKLSKIAQELRRSKEELCKEKK